MAEEMEMNGEDFSQDVQTNEESMNGNDSHAAGGDKAANGGGDNNNGSAEAPGRDDDRKLFVGGLNWETSEKELREHFSQFGDIESINVKTDPQTGRSRGFAFIVFSAAEAIEKVTAAGDHIINNKKVDPKKAKARQGKIFVGGLTTEISDDEIKAYFSQFGNIAEMEMPFDKQKNQRKGFCFITFDSEQVVNELLKTPKQTISGKEVDVKRATPKPDNMPGMMMRGGGGGRGGPRGMRGGRGGGYNQGWGNNSNWSGGGYGQNYNAYGGYDSYGAGFDYYGGYGNYGGYDYPGYTYDYGGYEGGYNRSGGPRGGGGGGNYQGGKQRGGGGGGGGQRQQRHQPY